MKSNFWFKDGKPKYAAILACLNDVVFLDWTLLEGGQVKEMGSKRYRWIVYDASDTSGFGEWWGHKTRKEALAHFNRLGNMRPRQSVNDFTR